MIYKVFTIGAAIVAVATGAAVDKRIGLLDVARELSLDELQALVAEKKAADGVDEAEVDEQSGCLSEAAECRKNCLNGGRRWGNGNARAYWMWGCMDACGHIGRL